MDVIKPKSLQYFQLPNSLPYASQKIQSDINKESTSLQNIIWS